ncbi:hypothetical protein D1BOALGB6SA_3746 [Olavius sp. associated proteobacterium Delta 1]|nr:hypothetical protein D1BOALGB6SA_3746 [Olavius sp. associated proteobacterium Delta 1]
MAKKIESVSLTARGGFLYHPYRKPKNFATGQVLYFVQSTSIMLII